MFCPRCGQQQLTEEVRFCSRCGFPLDTIAGILAGGGTLPSRARAAKGDELSPRRKGIRQGAMLMSSTLAVVTLLLVLGATILNFPGELIPLVGGLMILGGLLRILYAVFYEDASAPAQLNFPPSYIPPPSTYAHLNRPERRASLPPPYSTPAFSHMPHRPANTSEMAPPSGVGDPATRLLQDTPENDKQRRQ
ncbi:MAG TPA: zinc ribbon domain-containing protein [Pyrinomonadaceae bacterium]|jgi:hypothetical protein|nr:zinc ribbon domain-containing protein [Pyrinomonadaceae bacterium]